MTPAIQLLEKHRIPFQLHHYVHDDACTEYGQEAAVKLGVSPDLMYKTLVVQDDGGTLALALVRVSDLVDLKRLADALGCKKARLADASKAEKTTGYVLGGISPLGTRKPLPVLVDTSLVQQSSLFISAGKRGCQLELSASDLIHLLAAQVVPLAVSGGGK
ncbi:MAG TPA: Cys-tRNA(Pro) deacylase [Gemmatales bacterium]|nr:Cys-tRNA(Pro) deacylase [Gemmatales bacterium]HMP15775.1 Cys-tRNA(Pro) deacylase [Gemmatales bacterium]